MADFRKLAIAAILADGKIDEAEVKVLSKELKNAEKKYDDDAIHFLVDLREVAQKKAKANKEELTDKFEDFFFKVIQENVLKDGKIDAKEAGWLRQTLFADGKIDGREMKFMETLNKKAKEKAPAFETLYQDCEKKHNAQSKAKK